MPGKSGYVAAALIALASTLGIFALVAWLVLAGGRQEQFLAPGRHAVSLDPGTHILWNDYRTLYGGRTYDEPQSLPRGMQITVTEAASRQAVAVQPDGGSSMTSGSTKRASAARFVIERKGGYDIAVSGDFAPRVFSVGENLLPRILWAITGIGLLVFAGFGGSLALFAWTYFRREQAVDAAQPLAAAAEGVADDASLRRIAAVVYGLQVASVFFGLTLFAGILINYLKLADARGTWIESHFRWQMRTFWITLAGLAIGLATVLILVGFVVLLGTVGWMLYRALKGWLELAERRPVRL